MKKKIVPGETQEAPQEKSITLKRLLTTEEVMKILQVSETKVYQLTRVKDDPLLVVELDGRTRRYEQDAFADWIKRRTKQLTPT